MNSSSSPTGWSCRTSAVGAERRSRRVHGGGLTSTHPIALVGQLVRTASADAASVSARRRHHGRTGRTPGHRASRGSRHPGSPAASKPQRRPRPRLRFLGGRSSQRASVTVAPPRKRGSDTASCPPSPSPAPRHVQVADLSNGLPQQSGPFLRCTSCTVSHADEQQRGQSPRAGRGSRRAMLVVALSSTVGGEEARRLSLATASATVKKSRRGVPTPVRDGTGA